MNILKFIKNITNRLNNSNNTCALFDRNIKKEKEFLALFNEPSSNIERSYFQYRCQVYNKKAAFNLINNIAGFLLFPIYFIKVSATNINSKEEDKLNNAIFFTEGISKEIIPLDLKSKYENIIPVGYAEEMFIDNTLKNILKVIIKKYWHSPYFVFKAFLKLSMYSAKINLYNPEAIITYNEYSFTSSLLTEYCTLMGIKHINVMHGEKLFNIRDSFVIFDNYYVWDEYYVTLLVKLRAHKDQFIISRPESLKLKIDDISEKKYFVTYYLGAEDEEELRDIKKVLNKIKDEEKRICVRYHPRFSNKDKIKQIFSEFVIENPKDVTLDESFSSTSNIVSLYSTVLFQAYVNEIDVVIDDISNPHYFNKLVQLEYIMLSKTHKRLSEFID